MNDYILYALCAIAAWFALKLILITFALCFCAFMVSREGWDMHRENTPSWREK